MSKRALILWTALAVLLLSAAQSPVSFPWNQSPRSSSSPDTSSRSAHFELLSGVYGAPETPPLLSSPLLGEVDEPTLWLARAIYSETKLPHEQELVAWVVRNRVETGYRGESTYREVVLDPYQFSAFNPGSSKRHFYTSLTPDTRLSSWQQALWIAHYVRHADPAYRPFSVETRHFFSERSMRDERFPFWASHEQFVAPSLSYEVDERRFRFYKEVS